MDFKLFKFFIFHCIYVKQNLLDSPLKNTSIVIWDQFGQVKRLAGKLVDGPDRGPHKMAMTAASFRKFSAGRFVQ